MENADIKPTSPVIEEPKVEQVLEEEEPEKSKKTTVIRNTEFMFPSCITSRFKNVQFSHLLFVIFFKTLLISSFIFLLNSTIVSDRLFFALLFVFLIYA